MHKLTTAQIALMERCAMTGEQIEAAGPRRFAARTVATLTAFGLIEQSKRVGLVLTAKGWQWLLDNRAVTIPRNALHDARTAVADDEAANWPRVEIATPAPLDIPAAVREYIEAEWRGAALVMSAKRGEIIAALLAADPELSNTAATFRFHNLVAEMRDNDSIEPLPGAASFMPCPRGCGVDVRNHHSSDSVNGGCDTGPMSATDMHDWFAARGVGQPGYPMADAIAEHYGKTEDELNEMYDAMHGPIA